MRVAARSPWGPSGTPLDSVSVPSWMSASACLPERSGLSQAEVDAIFFPKRGQSVARARTICAGCAVRDECLDLALTAKIKFGIWGGTTERERRKLLRGAERTERRATPAA